MGVILAITLIMTFCVFGYQDKKISTTESEQHTDKKMEDSTEEKNFNNTLDFTLLSICLTLMFSVGRGLYMKYKK